ncbi:metal ABC transporter solute-binding protein, Zn/Mn family [Desulfovibrio sp. SGI.169]|uniref:metal ABC transporter solute-binding protein, Zn/Mn family n=1 Tax=Desulfovibrio sp. SGI.169 TaxID=3420561 RepID=UPI003D080669
MHIRNFLPYALLLLALCWGGNAAAEKPLKIIAGTSLIEDIARDLSGSTAEILTLAQGSNCPGHENFKTGDFVFAAESDILLLHAFQRDMPQVKTMLEAVKNKGLRVVFVPVRGSWLIPDNQKEASRHVAAALAKAAPHEAAVFTARLQKRLARVDSLGAECLAMLAPVRGKAVLASAMQAEFLAWAGLDVLRTYGRAEDAGTGALAQVLRAVRGKKICGVIDNRQSGGEAGLPLALELKTPHLVLSSFPGSGQDVPDYFSLLRVNAQALARL